MIVLVLKSISIMNVQFSCRKEVSKLCANNRPEVGIKQPETDGTSDHDIPTCDPKIFLSKFVQKKKKTEKTYFENGMHQSVLYLSSSVSMYSVQVVWSSDLAFSASISIKVPHSPHRE